jgi:cerevisin
MLTTLFLFSLVYSLILIPKPFVSTLDLSNFNIEYKIYKLASIGSVNIYKTDVFYNLETLNTLFDIEEEQIYSIELNKIPWHLDRIVKKDLPLNNVFNVSDCNINDNIIVNNIVIDTGIDIIHPEFEGRAKWLGNFIDKEDFDGNSHGTHCAGVIGSKTFGVCKDANLYAIKVLGSDGSGSTSSVISGIEAAYKFHIQQQKLNSKIIKTIVSMSLGGGKSLALNRIVQETIKNDNFYFSAAAGNENSDSCYTSPASAIGIFTVMASDKTDTRAYFSNFGKCSDIYSPGVDIQSTIPGNNTAIYSGTSFSSPILVGVMNHYINRYSNLNMKQLKEKMLSDSTKNKIKRNSENTNNFLVYLDRDL